MKRAAPFLWLLCLVIVLYNASGALKEMGVLPKFVVSQRQDGDLLYLVTDTSVLSATSLQRALVNVAFGIVFLYIGYIIGTKRSWWYGAVALMYFLIQCSQVFLTGNLFRSEWTDEIMLVLALGTVEVILYLSRHLKVAWRRKET